MQDIFLNIGEPIAVILSIMVLLYAFGDTFINRIAVHIFIGAAAGYAGAITIKEILIPRLSGGFDLPTMLTLLWVVLLFMKISPRTASLGNPGSALLVGVGAAIAVGGAIQGTLIPQVVGAADFFDIGDTFFQRFFYGSVTLIGTITTMIYFHFGAKQSTSKISHRNRIIEWISKVGQVFIAITLGVIFAGVYSAALAALVNRADFIFEFVRSFLNPTG